MSQKTNDSHNANIQYDYASIPYGDVFLAAETAHGLPKFLLVEVARAESQFNIYAKSPAGAQGIMQIVPKWHPGVDPYDPNAAIFYAANYLKQLYNKTGSWQGALGAYNWGIGNLEKYGWGRAPAETRNYVAKISARLPYSLS